MKNYISLMLFLFAMVSSSEAQDNLFSKKSIKANIGIAFNEGTREIGGGIVYSIGYQSEFVNNSLIRYSANLQSGNFRPILVTDTRDQFYRASSLGFNVEGDILKYKFISLTLGGGGFINYSRGLFGTGGNSIPAISRSEYFHQMYAGGIVSAGLRFAPEKRNIAFEIKPVNIQVGYPTFAMGYMTCGIDFKLMKRK